MSRLFILLFFLLGTAHGANPDNLLEPDKAFRLSARALDAQTVEVSFAIAEGYYMYRERFRFAVDPAAGVKLGPPQFPPGVRKKDEFFGEVETYRKSVAIRLPVEGGKDSFHLTVTSQGCADVGVCYVPMESKASIQLASAGSSGTGLASTPGADGTQRFSLFASDVDIARLFQGNFALVLASFLVFGLLLAFTPCVLPMIPILSGIIAGEGGGITKSRALMLSGGYVLSMAATYAVIGVAAAYAGSMLASYLQNAWVLTGFAVLFVVLALSMFGLYELQLPGFIHQPLSAAHRRLPGGQIASVAVMGVLSAIIVSPCVSAPLAAALLEISRTGDVAVGGAALFTMAIGMGLPLLVIGVSEGALLPKAGPWMVRVKQFFGVLMLGLAVWVVWPVLRPGTTATGFVQVSSVAELEQQLRSPGKPVMLDFYADWCVSCKEMEVLTFSDARVKAKLDGMRLLQADVTANTVEHKQLLKRFSLFGPPGIIFFDAQGREIKGLRVIGYQNAERFLVTLERATSF